MPASCPSFGHFQEPKINIPADMRDLVLHCCCAPCSGAVLECLLHYGIRPHIFFYNPNIYPRAEYEKRRDEMTGFAQKLGLEVTDGDYDAKAWMESIKGYEHEPERGARCQICFNLRLAATAAFARSKGITYFTTTLATSRWKDKKQVDAAGFKAQSLIEGTCYWDQDWRKHGLGPRRDALVHEIGFYNQDYCGCVFSKRDREAKLQAGTPSEIPAVKLKIN